MRTVLDFLPPDGDHFIHRAVADDFAHHGLGRSRRVSSGLRTLNRYFRIVDTVLHDPFDERRVEIPGDHGFLAILRVGVLAGIRRTRRAEAQFHLELPLHRDREDLIYAERQLEVQPRLANRVELAEAKHDADRLGGNGVRAREHEPQREDKKREDRHPSGKMRRELHHDSAAGIVKWHPRRVPLPPAERKGSQRIIADA